MNGMSWTARPVTPEERRTIYAQAASLDTEMARNSRAIRLGGYWVGGIGLLVGLIGIASAAAMLPLKRTVVEFIPWNTEIGVAGSAVLAQDAPETLFRDQQAQADLRRFVEAVETWVPALAKVNFHTVAVMSSLREQQILANAMDAKNPKSPHAVYGSKTSVIVSGFKFALRARDANGQQQWDVRYDRAIVEGNDVKSHQEWTSTVTFAWHPDQPMAKDDDRLLNLTGFQAVGYQSDAL